MPALHILIACKIRSLLCLRDELKQDLHDWVLEYLEADDVLCLADADLACNFGTLAAQLRTTIRQRRGLLKSFAWLDEGDLGAVTSAFLEHDPLISQFAFQVRAMQ